MTKYVRDIINYYFDFDVSKYDHKLSAFHSAKRKCNHKMSKYIQIEIALSQKIISGLRSLRLKP